MRRQMVTTMYNNRSYLFNLQIDLKCSASVASYKDAATNMKRAAIFEDVYIVFFWGLIKRTIQPRTTYTRICFDVSR